MSLQALLSKLSDGEENETTSAFITDDLLETLFAFRRWSPEQVVKNRAIRAAALRLARLKIEEEAATVAFLDAIRASGPAPVANPTPLQALAAQRRDEVEEKIAGWSRPAYPTEMIEAIVRAVRDINSAIGLEGARVDPTLEYDGQ
jgi:hypothetical protein